MTSLLCCRRRAMGAALSQEGSACEAPSAPEPPTMADVIRERKKKAGGAALGTLRRRIAAAARRPRDSRPDRGCEHGRYIRSVVSSWRLAEVFLLQAELEAGAALRDLSMQADLARKPANTLRQDLLALFESRCYFDVELVGKGWSVGAHRCILAARSAYFRHLLPRYPRGRVPLEGVPGSVPRETLIAALRLVYGAPQHHCRHCNQWERSESGGDSDLDIIDSTQRNNTWSGHTRCSCAGLAALTSLTDQLGVNTASSQFHRDINYLLDSGEHADTRLSFRGTGGPSGPSGPGGSSGPSTGPSSGPSGGAPALDLSCHRAILAARSTLFRKVLSQSCGGRSVWLDEAVVPRRFAPALLHCAYTDLVDLTLIQRAPSSPTSINSSGSSTTTWSVGRGNSSNARSVQSSQLEDAFQLYEIAMFIEMPILAQGCEDAAASLLSPQTLPRALRWAAAPEASAWLHRQASRMLLDSWWSVMGSGTAAARVPRSSMATALASQQLQASELQALRGLLRWGELVADRDTIQPNVVCDGVAGGSRRGRRRCPGDAAVARAVADLLPLLHLDRLPPDNLALQQAIRRGLVPPPPPLIEGEAASEAWLAPHRPPRAFLPYLDELKALLEHQPVPEAELARVRRARCLHRIPDTLYMVAAAGPASANTGANGGADACVDAGILRALRRRQRELRGAPPAVSALLLPLIDTHQVYRQIALRCVREMALPDSCADLLLNDKEEQQEREESWSEGDEVSHHELTRRDYCCRSSGRGGGGGGGGGGVGGGSHGSLRSVNSIDQHTGTGRSSSASLGRAGSSGPSARSGAGPVPDVALPPNGNTHLLAQHTHSYAGVGVLLLDLGDGATHTPRPGSRALRAATQHARHQREQVHQLSVSRPRAPLEDDDLRAAIEMSVIRAYGSPFGGPGRGEGIPGGGNMRRHTLQHNAQPRRLTPSPVAGGRRGRMHDHEHMELRGSEACILDGGSPATHRSHYRLDPSSYGGSSHSSRGPSPNNYA